MVTACAPTAGGVRPRGACMQWCGARCLRVGPTNVAAPALPLCATHPLEDHERGHQAAHGVAADGVACRRRDRAPRRGPQRCDGQVFLLLTRPRGRTTPLQRPGRGSARASCLRRTACGCQPRDRRRPAEQQTETCKTECTPAAPQQCRGVHGTTGEGLSARGPSNRGCAVTAKVQQQASACLKAGMLVHLCALPLQPCHAANNQLSFPPSPKPIHLHAVSLLPPKVYCTAWPI
jgi:hypothetical protein